MKRIALGAILVLTACHRDQPPPEKIPPSVRTGLVELQETKEDTKYSADVSADKQVDLSFRVSGYVQSLLRVNGRNVQEGDAVAAGAVLARIRTADYAAKVSEARSQVADAQANIEASRAQRDEAQAAMQKADQDLERARNLFSSRSLTKPDLDAAQAQRDTAHARVDAAAAQIRSLEAKAGGARAQQSEADVVLSDTALVAPFAGVVLARHVEEGTLAAPGVPAFTLADVRRVKVIMGVPDISLPQFRLGTALPVTTEAVSRADFNGRITSISPAADPKGRVFSVELTIANPRGVLKPGMIASVTVPSREASAVPAIPLSAVVESTQDADRYAVFVVQQRNGQAVAHRQKIVLGEVKGNRIAVREGLAAGQRIVISGGSLLTDGEPVVEIP